MEPIVRIEAQSNNPKAKASADKDAAYYVRHEVIVPADQTRDNNDHDRHPNNSHFRPYDPEHRRWGHHASRVTGRKGTPPASAMEGKEAKNAVANPRRIVAEPAFRPRPPERDLHCGVDLHRGENRQAKGEDNSATGAWAPTREGGDYEARKHERGDPVERLGRSRHESERTDWEQAAIVTRMEPYPPVVSQMLVHPGGDRSVHQFYANDD